MAFLTKVSDWQATHSMNIHTNTKQVPSLVVTPEIVDIDGNIYQLKMEEAVDEMNAKMEPVEPKELLIGMPDGFNIDRQVSRHNDKRSKSRV